MRPSNLLFDLVKSLSAEEESYFRQLTSLQQGDKNYFRIYSHLTTLSGYDEARVKYHFRNESFVKHFPSEKNQLMHHILKALHSHRVDNNTATYVSEQIKNIQLLYNKSLHRLARRELNRVKALAWKHEMFFSLLEIIELEKVVIDIEVRFDESDMKMLDELMKEKEDILNKLNNLQRLETLLGSLMWQYKQYSFARTPEERTKLEKMLGGKDLTDPSRLLSRKAALAANLCKMMAFRLLHLNEDFIQVANTVIRQFEQDESVIAEKRMHYIMAYSFLARAYAIRHQYNECFSCLDKIRSLQLSPLFKPVIYQISIFTRSVINDSMFYLYTGQFDRHRKMVPYLLKGMEKYSGKIPKDELCTLHYILFMSYFGNGDLSAALSWLNKILNAPEKEVRPDLYRISRLVNIIVHHELDHQSLLAYLFKSNQRYYDSQEQVYAFEKIFMKHFRKIALQRNKDDAGKHYQRLRTELVQAFKDPYQKFALEYFDFEAWVNAKIHHMSYRQVLQTSRQTS